MAAGSSLRLASGRMLRQQAHDGVTEPHPASAAAAPPGAPVPAPADTTEAVSFAPHPLRLLAFMIDLFLLAVATGAVAAVTGSLVVYAVVLLMAWVIYQTGSVWLTGGRTIGKAACSLSVRHIDGSAPRQDRAGLAWAFGRASLGYLVIDMGGLGILVGLRNPRRRCLHDYAFASEVVLHPDTGDPLHPRGRLERLRQRLQQFTEDRENAWEAKKKNYAFVATLWKWLVRITEISLAGLLFARDRWHAPGATPRRPRPPDHQRTRGQSPDRREDHHPGRHHHRRHRHRRRRRRHHLSFRAHHRRLG